MSARQRPGWPCIVVLACALAWTSAAPAQQRLEPDDEVLVYQTMARREGPAWVVPVHGRVFVPEHSVFRRRLFAAALDRALDVRPADADEQATFAARVDLFVADGKSGRHVRARVAGRVFEVGVTDDNGYFAHELTLAADALQPDSIVEVQVLAPAGDDRIFTGKVVVPGDGGLMVVSDIDDTVKISHVADHARLIESTFFRDFAAVPGMAELYRRWSADGAAFHFVSSSPWQLYAPLRDFLERAGFPTSAFHLKTAHLTDETVVAFFAKGTETKPAQIEPLLAAYPRHRFILVGDNGEQDPEVYADLLRRFPDRIERVYIRNVTGVPYDRWQAFTDPAEID